MPAVTLFRHRVALACLAVLLATATAADSPQQRYQQYLAAVRQAEGLNDLFPYLTAERIETIQRGLRQAAERGIDPAQVESLTLEMLKLGALESAQFRELVIDDEASVVVERTDVTVEVRMVLEVDGWKIADERMLKIPNVN